MTLKTVGKVNTELKLHIPIYPIKTSLLANSDCGYCGNVVLANGTFVTSTYGIFTPDEKRYTYIASKRIRLENTDKLVKEKDNVNPR